MGQRKRSNYYANEPNRHMKTLAIIPARGGSKGVPHKNIRMLHGKPLIAWTIEAALQASSVDDVVVSTEDDEIAEVAEKFGAVVPFIRPLELARDETPGIEPVLHMIEAMPGYSAVVVLQPTSPLRAAEDVDGCVDLARRLNAPAAVSVTRSDIHPDWMFRISGGYGMQRWSNGKLVFRRQDLEPLYVLNGATYFGRVEFVTKMRSFVSNSTVAFVMPEERSIDIDTILDFEIAELLLKNRS